MPCGRRVRIGGIAFALAAQGSGPLRDVWSRNLMLKMLYCSQLFQSHAPSPQKKNAQQNNLHVDAWATRASIGDAGGGLACAFNRAACNKFALALRCVCCPNCHWPRLRPWTCQPRANCSPLRQGLSRQCQLSDCRPLAKPNWGRPALLPISGWHASCGCHCPCIFFFRSIRARAK